MPLVGEGWKKRNELGATVALTLLGGATLLIGAVAVSDAAGRRDVPEEMIRTYFYGLESLDADLSVEQILPEERGRLTPFVENSVGNHYDIVGIAVEWPSLIERAGGAQPEARTATVFLDITQADGVRWQAGPRVIVIRRDGRWYLGDAPLRPPSSALAPGDGRPV